MSLPKADLKTLPPTKITVLISGTGSNLGKLIEATQAGGILAPHKIIRVISNRKNAGGLKLAGNAGIATSYHNLISGGYYGKGERDEVVIREGRRKYDGDLARMILDDGSDLVVCAGWMHILTPEFLTPLSTTIPVINLHPALPGQYDGISAIERAWNDFQIGKLEGGKTGVMVHYVVKEVDRGEPILVREVLCVVGESLEGLTERIHAVEHEIIVEGTGRAIVALWEERRGGGS